jgi:glutathione S-transferase
MSRKPVLWHIPVSHYSEKARWALAYKGIEHERRAPPPGAHAAIALALTRGAHYTFPVLRLDGRNIGDSSAIIAALEERWPEPALYPADEAERRRALELEEWFDESLGPAIRRFAWHELYSDHERMARLSAGMLPAALRRIPGADAGAARFGSTWVRLRFRVADDEAAEAARQRTLQAFDRLEAELGDGDYLAGDSFTVADLTAAALLYPVAMPPEGPQYLPDPPPAFAAFIDSLRGRRGFEWVGEMFRRHRSPAAVPA